MIQTLKFRLLCLTSGLYYSYIIVGETTSSCVAAKRIICRYQRRDGGEQLQHLGVAAFSIVTDVGQCAPLFQHQPPKSKQSQ